MNTYQPPKIASSTPSDVEAARAEQILVDSFSEQVWCWCVCVCMGMCARVCLLM